MATEEKKFLDRDGLEYYNSKIKNSIDGVENAVAARVKYFHITSSSTMGEIVDAFSGDEAKIIDFDYGTYLITEHIIIGSNTTVNLNGAMLKKSTVDIMFGYPLDTIATGFDGVHNVVFNNGTINLSMALMHNTNFVFNNITFGPDLNTHALQIAASKNIRFNSCVFKGRTIDASVTAAQQELLQIETATRSGQPWLIDPISISYDHMGNENIFVEGCTFESGDGENYGTYTCIGHHASDAEAPYAVKNMVIRNCTFGDSRYAPLTPAGWDGYEISNNTFTYSGSSTSMFIIRHRWFNRNGIIRDNVFNGGFAAMTNVNVEACSGLLFDGNDVTMNAAGSHCIDLVGWSDVRITNNVFRASKSGCINAYTANSIAPSNIEISNNIFNSNLETSSDIIYFSTGSNVSIFKNVSYQKTGSQHIASLGANYGDTLKYAHNTILCTNAAALQLTAASGTFPTPQYIYDTVIPLYSGENTYAALTNQTPDYPFSSFNKLYLLIHKSGDATIKTEYPIYAWTMGKRLSDNRVFYVSLPNTDGTMMLGTFTINSDGTYSYSSSTGNLTLRSIRGVNTNMYGR